jgi:uncharacterized paraquat-inducible protein A
MRERFRFAKTYLAISVVFNSILILTGCLLALIFLLDISDSGFSEVQQYFGGGLGIGLFITGVQSLVATQMAQAVLSTEENTYLLLRHIQESKLLAAASSDAVLICADCGITVSYSSEKCPRCGSQKRKWKEE